MSFNYLKGPAKVRAECGDYKNTVPYTKIEQRELSVLIEKFRVESYAVSRGRISEGIKEAVSESLSRMDTIIDKIQMGIDTEAHNATSSTRTSIDKADKLLKAALGLSEIEENFPHIEEILKEFHNISTSTIAEGSILRRKNIIEEIEEESQKIRKIVSIIRKLDLELYVGRCTKLALEYNKLGSFTIMAAFFEAHG